MARIPKQRVIFDAEKYDLDYLRETRDSYSPMTDAEFEDSISYDMGEDDLRDLMEMDWRSNEKALDAFLGKSILVRYSPVNYDDGFVQFNLNDLNDLLHAHTSPCTAWTRCGMRTAISSSPASGPITHRSLSRSAS